jgi:hypothetical protein
MRRGAGLTKEELDGDRIFVIHDFLYQGECAELIRRSESLAWEAGTAGGEIVGGVRTNERVLFDDLTLALGLFGSAGRSCPLRSRAWPIRGSTSDGASTAIARVKR